MAFAQPDSLDKVNMMIEQEMEMKGIPGLSYAVIKNDKVIKMGALGYANLDHNIPTSNLTVFPIASIDKQIIATCIMMLQEEGTLNIEDHVTKYLDSTPDSWKDMKIKHLLSHTSGLPDEPIEYYKGKGYDRYSSEDIYNHIIKQDIAHATGEKFLYSDSGFFLLQRIFEKASGFYYPTFIKENIFQPLGMENTRILVPTEIVAGRTVSYYRESKEKLHVNAYRQINLGPHFGDVGTTIEDFVKYDLALNTNKLLKKETYDLMWTPATVTGGRIVSQLIDENDLFNSMASYGYGWELGEYQGHRTVYHSGFTGTSIVKFPELELTVLLLTNLTYRPIFSPNALAKKIASFYLEDRSVMNNNEMTMTNIPTILEQLKNQKPDSSFFGKQFYPALLKALPNYNRKIEAFKELFQINYEYSTSNKDSYTQTYRANYRNGTLLYHVTFNFENLITLISIEQ